MKKKEVEKRFLHQHYGATEPRTPSPAETPYFPNAFFSSGSISPFAAIGSRISVSP